MSIAENYKELLEKIDNLKNRLNVSYDINVVAVTKTKPAESVKEIISAGAICVGENRVQEAAEKFKELEGLQFEKHLIGHLQENKANKAAEIFDFVQSIESIKTAKKLNRKCLELGKTMPVLIEIKTSDEATKFGLLPDLAEEFIGQLAEFEALKISGFMTIAPFTRDEWVVRAAFKKLYDLSVRMQIAYRNLDLNILSMGMSDDYEWAIEEGSNMIRPGRVLFGQR